MRLRVALFPADDAGCGQYRMRLPAAAAEVDTVCVRDLAEEPQRRAALAHADVVVFQRPAHQMIRRMIPAFQAAGKAVVVDLDDDFSALHPRHPAFATYHPSMGDREVSWHNLQIACRLADLVTVSTPALAQRYRRDAVILRNCVPASLLDTEARRGGRTVGWGGFHGTHVGDLEVTRGGVAQAVADTGARFLTVGPEGVGRQLGFDAEPAATGGIPFDQYHQALAQLDVGIVPLADSAFNAAKSALKGLEYAALGIPFIGSPRPEYELLHAQGVGLIARDRSRDWRRQTAALLSDEALRGELADRGRAQVLERHVLELNAWRWAEAWAEAVAIRRSSNARRVAA